MANANPAAQKFYWVVVADESRALIYQRTTRTGPLSEVISLTNETARKKDSEIVSDRGGRSFDSAGSGRHAMGNDRSGPKQHAAEVFAKDVATRIGDVVHDGSCRGYALVAAPRFLGMLRAAVAKTSNVEPYKTVDKDLVGHPIENIKSVVDSK
ncbi:MAG: host attachment protein [Woeseia sp.]|nr:host attachment protein [Woeseia sp.]MBT8097028.1 host attachment protein [Woeseia sp.]NNE61710.1 host attachment protein [Woeseia sp.]